MSYTHLIYKDSPEIIWSLNESDGDGTDRTIYPYGYLSGAEYEGEYLSGKYLKGELPITYGGKIAIYNKGSYLSNYCSSSIPEPPESSGMQK